MLLLYLIFSVRNCRLRICKQIALQMFGSNLRTNTFETNYLRNLHCRQYRLKFVKCLLANRTTFSTKVSSFLFATHPRLPPYLMLIVLTLWFCLDTHLIFQHIFFTICHTYAQWMTLSLTTVLNYKLTYTEQIAPCQLCLYTSNLFSQHIFQPPPPPSTTQSLPLSLPLFSLLRLMQTPISHDHCAYTMVLT